MIVRVWEGNTGITVLVKGARYQKFIREDCVKLIREIKGKDWNECMKKHHKLMGWEPYKPF